MSKLLVLFPLGSEVRQFGHSGLLKLLLNKGWQVTVVAKLVDDDLKNQIDPRVRLVPYPRSKVTFMYHRIASILDKAHCYKERKGGRTGWQYKTAVPKNWKVRLIFYAEDVAAALLSLSAKIFRIGSEYEMSLLRKSITPEWSSLISEVRPDAILVNTPKARMQLPALAMARQWGIATVVIYHTWKDVSTVGRLSPVFDRLGVWNDTMRDEVLRQNNWLRPDAISIVGCSHFDCVGREDLLLPKNELRDRLKLNQSSPLLLYVASAPWIVPEEERYIRILRHAILDGRLPKATQIVVRTNPMDNTKSLQKSLQHDTPQVVVAKPDWRWDPQINWCFQRKDDLRVYNSLLHYASVSVGVPSTATIECAVADLPIVNVGFDLPGPKPFTGIMRSFWDADYYQDVRNTDAAVLANNVEQMVSHVASAMENRSIKRSNRQALISSQLGVAPPQAVPAAADLLSRIGNGMF